MAEPTDLLSRSSERGHLQGPGNAPITLVNYGDFECAASGALATLLTSLIKEFGPDLDVVFKYFPMVEKHPRAMATAQAAETAAWQGKFWEMHDLLFQNQKALDASSLRRYAAEIGLDMDRFDVDFSRRDVLAVIERDIQQGLANGVTTTPALFLNGERYTGALDAGSLRETLQKSLKTYGRSTPVNSAARAR